jgi:glycosyltransferase involved in cell wall biosynthesis
MQLLGIVLIKNDAPVLQATLTRLAECCDGIIALNDGSVDDSENIIAACDKIIHVINNPLYKKWDPFDDLNRILKLVHEIKPEWVMFIDSDDLIDKRFIERKQEMLSRPGVGRYWFKEITLWFSKTHYRVDKPEKYGRETMFTPYLIKYNPLIKIIPVGEHHKFKHKLIYFVRQSAFISLFGKTIFPYKFFVSLNEGKFKSILKALFYPSDSHDITHVRIGGEEGEAVISGLVRVHYHYSSIYYAARKHINFALLIAIRQCRTDAEITDLTIRFSQGINDEGLQLKEVDSAWGVI